MGTLAMIGAVIMILVSILIVVLISLQDPKGDGIASLGGGNSFLSGGNDRSIDAKLNNLTKILSVVFLVLAFAVYLFVK